MYGCVNVQALTLKRISMLMLCVGLVACGARNEPAPVASVYTGKTIHDYERASLAAQSYQVEPGETLYSIAFRANKDVRELAQLNNISAPYTIYPGQTLRLSSSQTANKTAQKPSTKPAPVKKQSTRKASGTTVASQQKKEYVKNNGKELASSKKTATKVVVPSTGTETTLTNEDINWQWPSKAQIISDFSLQQAGNKGLDFGGERGTR